MRSALELGAVISVIVLLLDLRALANNGYQPEFMAGTLVRLTGLVSATLAFAMIQTDLLGGWIALGITGVIILTWFLVRGTTFRFLLIGALFVAVYVQLWLLTVT